MVHQERQQAAQAAVVRVEITQVAQSVLLEQPTQAGAAAGADVNYLRALVAMVVLVS
jgi:hypothetical protein